jgi:hypothetical protein
MGDDEKGASRAFDASRVVTLCAPLLGLGAFALLEWADWGAGPDPGASGGKRELDIWTYLVTVSVVMWAVLAGVGLRLLQDLDGPWRETAPFVLFVLAVIGIVLTLGGIAGLRNPFVMDGQDWKIPLLHLVAGAANLPLLAVLKRIQLTASDDASWSATVADFERIRSLRRAMNAATAALGLVIALAVVATGALREATAAAGLDPVPETFVLVYGAWFTGVVAAIYLYVFGAIEARARWMLDRLAPLGEVRGSGEAFVASRGLRHEVAEELELGGDARRNLEGLLAVLAPLVGALLTRLGGL